MTRLLVVLEDRISDWAEKGEITLGYFNPTGMFERVDLLLVNDDSLDPDVVAQLVSPARGEVHHVAGGPRYFVRTLGYQGALLRRWERQVAAIARSTQPDVIRVYGARLNGLAACVASRVTGAPLAVSLHIEPERDWRSRFPRTPVHSFYANRLRSLERAVLSSADVVLPVYSSIARYLDELGIDNHEIVHNAVGPPVRREEKSDPSTDRHHVVTVGRQIAGHKDPTAILRAVGLVPEVRLTVVGDGPLHGDLVELARDLQLGDRVRFVRALPNHRVMTMLGEADVFAYSTTYAELSKAVIEAALSGLPIVHSALDDGSVRELDAPGIILVPDTAEGFARALRTMIDDPEQRRELGASARRHAERHWSPDAMEAKVAGIYRRLLGARA